MGSRLMRVLPRGTALPDDAWRRRHFGLLVLLWVHVPGLVVFGVVRGETLDHSLLEGIVVAAFALPASVAFLGRQLRTVSSTLGLVVSSSLVVHLSGASSEAHFHFFVMVAAVSLYQSWLPFLLAVGFVVGHHGLVGAVDPSAVYNHPAAVADPWTWAAIHGAFILAESVALLTTWRMSEGEREETARVALELQLKDVTHRQALEINDTVVQGLTVAKYAIDLGDTAMAVAALDRTLEAARTLVGRLLEDTAPGTALQPGDLVREQPAVVLAEVPVP